MKSNKYGWTEKFRQQVEEYYKENKEVKNMEIDKILIELAAVVGKPKGILTRSYNQIKAEKEEAGLTVDVLPEDRLQRVILLGICDKYELDESELDKYFNDDDEDEPVMIERSVTDTLNLPVEDFEDNQDDDEEDWTGIFKSTPAPKKFSSESNDGQYKNTPSLVLIDRTTYKLKVADPSKKPRELSGISKNGYDYDSILIDVELISLSDPTLYEDVFEDGEFKGEAMFKQHNIYTLWLNRDKGFPEFVELWRDKLGLPKPDGRPFYLKRYKKKSKKGRKYNVFNFAVK